MNYIFKIYIQAKEIENSIESLIHPVLYVPESKKISQLFQEFKNKTIFQQKNFFDLKKEIYKRKINRIFNPFDDFDEEIENIHREKRRDAFFFSKEEFHNCRRITKN